jgi:adenylosuccinate lyase
MKEPYWTVSPLDFRYYGQDKRYVEELAHYVSEAANIKYQAKVEACLATMLARWGICSEQIADDIAHACEEVTVDEVYAEERKIGHGIRALVNCIRRRLPPSAQPYVHLFATSADIIDTANSLRLNSFFREIVLPDLLKLQMQLIKLARLYADVVQVGRTHGQHAEPITFGYSIANYVSRLGQRIEKIIDATNNLRGKFSGAVGAYNALSLVERNDPALLELEFLRELGLKPADNSISTQIVQPEYTADLAYAVVSCYSVFANLADDIRHLRRTEIEEIQEEYNLDKVGSSTMPHKVNPRDFENVKSMWKVWMPRMITIFMDQISEHQRDLTNSASNRFIIELFVAFDYSARRLSAALLHIRVDSDKMRKNLETSRDLFVAEPLYILLAINGFADAYDYTRSLVAKAKKSGVPLTKLIWKEEEIQSFLQRLKPEQAEILKDPTRYVGASRQRTNVTCDYWEDKVMHHLKYVSPNALNQLKREMQATAQTPEI